MNDRTVHAILGDESQVVRYERAGKWYLEHDNRPRIKLSLRAAANHATTRGAQIFFGRSGGKKFDAMVRGKS